MTVLSPFSLLAYCFVFVVLASEKRPKTTWHTVALWPRPPGPVGCEQFFDCWLLSVSIGSLDSRLVPECVEKSQPCQNRVHVLFSDLVQRTAMTCLAFLQAMSQIGRAFHRQGLPIATMTVSETPLPLKPGFLHAEGSREEGYVFRACSAHTCCRLLPRFGEDWQFV